MDRNQVYGSVPDTLVTSLSARRAWIEIGTDREKDPAGESLSARRAWIEISVIPLLPVPASGRSPQGERG